MVPEHHDHHTRAQGGGASDDGTDAGRCKHDMQDVHSVIAI